MGTMLVPEIHESPALPSISVTKHCMSGVELSAIIDLFLVERQAGGNSGEQVLLLLVLV